MPSHLDSTTVQSKPVASFKAALKDVNPVEFQALLSPTRVHMHQSVSETCMGVCN